MTDVKIPKTLGACADKLYKLRAQRYELQRKVAEIKAQETQLKEHLIRELPKSEASGIAGRSARAKVTSKELPQVADWGKFFAYVKRKNAFHLLQRRLSAPAIQEVWDDGKKVPGIEVYNKIDVSVTKV